MSGALISANFEEIQHEPEPLHFLGTALSGALFAAVGAGCGSDATTTGSGGSTGTTTASTTTTTTTTGTGGSEPQGPGATLKCDSSGKNAFETYGAAGFVAVNKAIFANVGAEITANGTTNLGDSFGKVTDAATFEGNLAAFLVFAYGGPTSIVYTDNKTYNGPQDMVAAHSGLAITADQYTYFVTNVVVPALTSSGVKHGAGGAADPDDVSSCFAPVVLDKDFIASVVGH
ncbi:MAG: hypothetical protein V9G22_15730 [Ottowia sp.]